MEEHIDSKPNLTVIEGGLSDKPQEKTQVNASTSFVSSIRRILSSFMQKTPPEKREKPPIGKVW